MTPKVSTSLEIECPICKKKVDSNIIREHIMKVHGKEEFKIAVLRSKENGMSDLEIGKIFGITFNQLEKIITEIYGINISVLKKPKKIKYWLPKSFKEETTTVWSFKQRGDWATHNGKYRGNWSPYIPRNIILKYSKPGDMVLDYFVGSGTTAVEAKLLGRRCIAKDINQVAIALTKENLDFTPPKTFLDNYKIFEPKVSVGDARDLSDIPDESIDLICAHPPYAGIINYSSKIEKDLSNLNVEDFLKEMKKVARESYRVLKHGGKCAILIGDTRKKKHVVPIGFKTIKVFLDAGFNLKEMVIKRQHNCRATGFWYERSIKYNFLLLAHEYLPIFEKPNQDEVVTIEKNEQKDRTIPVEENLDLIKIDSFETTTVWIFPDESFSNYVDTNIVKRYCKDNNYLILGIHAKDGIKNHYISQSIRKYGLLYLKSPFLSKATDRAGIDEYLSEVKAILSSIPMEKEGYIVIETQDVRIDGNVFPTALNIVELLQDFDFLWLKEIVISTTKNQQFSYTKSGDYLKITHKYLLIYEIIK